MTFRMPDSYYDPPEQPDEVELRREVRKAKNLHHCSMCSVPIYPGEEYVRYILKSPDYPKQIKIEKTHNYDCFFNSREGDY